MTGSLPGMLGVNPGGSWGGDIWWFIALTGAGWSPGGCGRFCSLDGPTLFPSLGPLPNSAFCIPGTRLEFFGPAFCIPGTRLEFFGPRFSMAAILFISTTNPFSFFTIYDSRTQTVDPIRDHLHLRFIRCELLRESIIELFTLFNS